jgi:RHH-type transcriptional regulator, proline utilization regulon repressor / proline dehydrogenase / delta 1-pyrroline-5-carboxylate dehydrogenase
VRYASRDLDRVIGEINATGYALTLGVHSRIDARAREIFRKTRAGNVYVNRNMVGAVVGVQPFGGSGLSGTGPKAGGPGYLQRFTTERTLTINTTAAGGNASLLSLGEG